MCCKKAFVHAFWRYGGISFDLVNRRGRWRACSGIIILGLSVVCVDEDDGTEVWKWDSNEFILYHTVGLRSVVSLLLGWEKSGDITHSHSNILIPVNNQ